MLKRLIILAISAILLMPTVGLCEPVERGIQKHYLPFMQSDDLIHLSYLRLVEWVTEHGDYSGRGNSKMKYLRLVEVFDSPYVFCSTDVKTPKIRKLYFQMVAKAKVRNPSKPEDIESMIRIVEVIIEHKNGKLYYSYHVAADKNLSGLPNEVQDWTVVKDLKGHKVSSTPKKSVDAPPEAEIVDLKWAKYLADFIKIYHLDLMESWGKPGSEERGPELKEVILEALYGKESAGRSGHNPMPSDQSLLWAGFEQP